MSANGRLFHPAERLKVAYSVEKLDFSAEAIFPFYGNAAENLRKTRRTADWERLRAEIVTSDCSPERREFRAFYSATIFHPNTRTEFFNRIGRSETDVSTMKAICPVSTQYCRSRTSALGRAESIKYRPYESIFALLYLHTGTSQLLQLGSNWQHPTIEAL
jgi:hypothetical protein